MTWKEYSEHLEELLSSISLSEDNKAVVNSLINLSKVQVNDNLTRYILVEWPETAKYIDGPRHKECIRLETGAYMIPEDLYWEINKAIMENLSGSDLK